MILEVKNVTRQFGGLTAVRDVSFSVREAEFLGLIGPNGAGKTTLFNLIAGTLPPTTGEILFQGQRVSGFPENRVCKLGIARTFQIVKPFGYMTVLENVLVGSYNRSRGKPEALETATQVMARLGLWDRRDALARELPLAQKKKLEVARALATGPRLLLLDEVMAGLNPSEMGEMMQSLSQLRQDLRLTIIAVEHVMKAIMGMSDRAVVLSEGRLIAEGTPSEIVKDPKVIESYLGEKYRAAH